MIRVAQGEATSRELSYARAAAMAAVRDAITALVRAVREEDAKKCDAEALIEVARVAEKYRNALTSFTKGIYGGELDRALSRLKGAEG
jgi:hypothetical protein